MNKVPSVAWSDKFLKHVYLFVLRIHKMADLSPALLPCTEAAKYMGFVAKPLAALALRYLLLLFRALWSHAHVVVVVDHPTPSGPDLSTGNMT